MLFKKKISPPIEYRLIAWLDNAYQWLIKEFGVDIIKYKKVLRPINEDFPLDFENNEATALKLLPIIADQMDMDHKKIQLHFYEDNLIELQNDLIQKIYTQRENPNTYTGFYAGMDPLGNHIIYLDRAKFLFPENMIATIASKLAHVILYTKNIREYNGYLVDLLTVFYGLGIFNANASFRLFNSNEGWRFIKQGHFKQQAWAYALAQYCVIRQEEKNCSWSQYLTPNIKSDFIKSLDYILIPRPPKP